MMADEAFPWISWKPGEEENDWEEAKREAPASSQRIVELEKEVAELKARNEELERRAELRAGARGTPGPRKRFSERFFTHRVDGTPYEDGKPDPPGDPTDQ
jgi:hypothetical protein